MSYFDINRYQKFNPQNSSNQLNTQFLNNFETPSIITSEQLYLLQTTNLQTTNLQTTNLQTTNLQTTNLQTTNLQTTLRFKPIRRNISDILDKSMDQNILDKSMEQNILEKLREKSMSKTTKEDKELGIDKYNEKYKDLDIMILAEKLRSITNQNFNNWTKDHIISDLIEYKRFKIKTDNKYIEDLNKYYENENIDNELKDSDKIIEELINLSKDILNHHKKDIKKLYKEYMKNSYTELKLLFEKIPKPKILSPNLTTDNIRRFLINNYKNDILYQNKLLPQGIIPSNSPLPIPSLRVPKPLSRLPIPSSRLPIPSSRLPIPSNSPLQNPSNSTLQTPSLRVPKPLLRLNPQSETLKIPLPKILPMNLGNLSTYLNSNDNKTLSAEKKSDVINSIKYYDSLGLDQLQDITKFSLSKREIIQKLISEEKLNTDLIYNNGK